MRVESIFWLTGFVILFFSFAEMLAISEVQFDPEGTDTDREWIEIFNDTNTQIDLTEVKFFEANVNHGISLFNQEGSNTKEIAPGEYVVLVQDIAKFKLDFPTYTGKIFKSSFSLSNSGEYLALKDSSLNILHAVNYTASDKQTTPSPGSYNLPPASATSTPVSNATTTENNSSTTNTISDVNFIYRNYWPDSEKIYLKAGENQTVMQGQEISFNPKVLDGNKKEIKVGLQYRWNFGDGNVSEKREGLHRFRFVGEYVVGLQANYNGIVEETKVYVKVVEPKIKIKIKEHQIEVGTSSEKVLVDVVEIKNLSDFELDLGNLKIKNEANKIFDIPEKLFILPGRSIYLPPDLTGFASTTNKVQIYLSSGKIIDEFFADTRQENLPKVVVATTSMAQQVPKPKPIPKKVSQQKINLKPSVKDDFVKNETTKIKFDNSEKSLWNKIFSFFGT